MATSHRRSDTKPKPKSEPGPEESGTRWLFEGLQDRGYEPILKGESGTMRFDLSRGSRLERWYITVANGKVTVSHGRVQYPTACTPQAWSTAAPLLLLRTMFGLEPVDDHLIVDPAIPASLGQLELLDIPGRWGRIDAFGRVRVASSPTKRRRAGSR